MKEQTHAQFKSAGPAGAHGCAGLLFSPRIPVISSQSMSYVLCPLSSVLSSVQSHVRCPLFSVAKAGFWYLIETVKGLGDVRSASRSPRKTCFP